MKKNRMIHKITVLILALTMLLSLIPLTASAGIEETVVATTADFGLADVENIQVYAMKNIGSGKWATTSTNSAQYFYIWNLYQKSIWNNSAQNFKFVKTDIDDHTYIIYPLEYNGYNASEARALSCNYKAYQNSATKPEKINVRYDTYTETAKQNFEWIVDSVDGNVHTIRLKADPTYILTVNGTVDGSDSGSGITSDGNIVAQKTASSNSVPTSYQKWSLTYVIEEGEYYIKNRADSSFVTTTLEYKSEVFPAEYVGGNTQIWNITHIQNGLYQIKTTGTYVMTLAYGIPEEQDVVFVDISMVQSKNWWQIERLEGGSFKISNAQSESAGVDCSLYTGIWEVIGPPAPDAPNRVLHGTYSNDTDRHDEWFLIPTDGIYGMQTFYDLDDNSSVNCHGYAMMTENDPEILNEITTYYYIILNSMMNQGQIAFGGNIPENAFHEEIITGFESWMASNSYIFEEDQGNSLSPNQFRVAINTGIHFNYEEEVINCDYHFWFQTYTGQWADKHGIAGIPELLDYGITPYTQGTSGWAVYGEVDFYDELPKIYVITIP